MLALQSRMSFRIGMDNVSNGSHKTSSLHDHSSTRDLVVLAILGVTITVINGLILISFVMRRKLRRRPANIMICSQACTDLFTALVYIPVYLTQEESTIMFLNCYMLYLSLFSLAIISIDRYLATNRPFIHRRFINVSRTIKLVALVWICPLALTLIPFTWVYEKDTAVLLRSWKIYISTIWLLMLVLVVSMSVLYIHVSRSAKRTIQRRRTSSQNNRFKARAQLLARKELRVIHLFGLLLSFFVGAYFPILYINFCLIIEKPEYIPPEIIPMSLYLLIFNSVLNPIICIMLKKDYLFAIKQIFLLGYGFRNQFSISSIVDHESSERTPFFNRRGIFKMIQPEDIHERKRMVSDQTEYSSTANNDTRQRMMSECSSRSPLSRQFPVEIVRRPAIQNGYLPKGNMMHDKTCRVNMNVGMETIAERDEMDPSENASKGTSYVCEQGNFFSRSRAYQNNHPV